MQQGHKKRSPFNKLPFCITNNKKIIFTNKNNCEEKLKEIFDIKNNIITKILTFELPAQVQTQPVQTSMKQTSMNVNNNNTKQAQHQGQANQLRKRPRKDNNENINL